MNKIFRQHNAVTLSGVDHLFITSYVNVIS